MTQLRIGTFNIQHGKDHLNYLKTKEDKIDLPLMASLIREEALDVCALNEVRNEENTPVMCNQARVIGEALGYHYFFAKAIDFRGGEYGNAIVSRYPIRSVKTYPIAIPKDARVGKHYYEDRVLLAADIDVNGALLTVFSCHIGLAPLEQERAVETARLALKEASHPVVFLGDFNVTPDTEIYAAIAESFTDAADANAPYFTYPSHAPSRKIDYIFTANGASASDFAACPRVLSDHLAVKAEISF